jgi:hypothetical protein
MFLNEERYDIISKIKNYLNPFDRTIVFSCMIWLMYLCGLLAPNTFYSPTSFDKFDMYFMYNGVYKEIYV